MSTDTNAAGDGDGMKKSTFGFQQRSSRLSTKNIPSGGMHRDRRRFVTRSGR